MLRLEPAIALTEARFQPGLGAPAEDGGCLRDLEERMLLLTGARGPVLDWHRGAGNGAKDSREVVDRGCDPRTDVEGPIVELPRGKQRSRCGEKSRLGDVAHVHVVAGLRSLAIDRQRAFLEDP